MLLKSTLSTALMLLSYLTSFSQAGFPYNSAWKRIDSLMNQKNLPKSALTEVNRVYAAAKNDLNEAQWVKAIIFKNHLQESEDRNMGQQITDLENKISNAPQRVAALLKSIEAEQINQYGLEYGYRFRNRTDIVQDTSADISTSNIKWLNDKIRTLYLSSLENPGLLQKTALEPFDPILIPGNSRDLRPSLFDLLSWRALDYFQSAPSSVTNDSLSYNPYLFSEAPFFMHLSFVSADSISNTLNALKIYQQLLRFHAKDIPADAWIDADNHRIQFVYQYSNLPDKDSLYLNALRRITNQYPSFSASTQSWYLQAKYWADKASAYQPLGDTLNRYDYLKAISLCNQAIKYQDSSEGKSNAIDLLREIKRQHFSLTVEGVNIPEQPFRAFITYRNISHLFGRIIKINEASWQLIDKSGMDVKSWNRLDHMPVDKIFQQEIPETGDHQQHNAEIKIGALPAGQYILLTSSDSAFNDQSMLSMTRFFSSSIAFVKNGFDYFVLDRDSGHPLKGVTIKTFIQKNVRSEYQYTSAGSYFSDINGHFKLLLRDEQYGSVKLEFYLGKDYFTSDEYIDNYNNDERVEDDKRQFEKVNLRDNLFTDRAIYRPGQTVYFKSLLITKDFKTKKYKPVSEKNATIFLKDANDQKIDSLVLKSSDFGSVHGSFHLPAGLLNGEFSLNDGENKGYISFSVEEYKRPSFYVDLDSLKRTYSIGDTIAVKGSATAYAGNSINAATLSWHVTRAPRFPYPWMFRVYPSKSSTEIASGTTQTDANGQFTIRFPAIADASVSKTSGPIYNYQIETTVTDISGETRSANTTVSVSYHSFEIISSLPLQSRVQTDGLHQIPVTTRNMAGSFILEKLTVSVSALQGPSRLIRKRYWQQPDQFTMSEPDYIHLFPHDEYRNESDIKSWKQGPAIFDKTDSTKSSGLFTIDRKLLESLKPGWYVLEFKVYDKGDLVSDKRYIEITNSTSASPGYVYNIISHEEITSHPGEIVPVNTGSDAQNIFVIRAKQPLVDSLTSFSFYGLSQEIKKSTVDVRESDRGGFALNEVFVKNNRWYTSQHIISVPWINKELKISYLTWKDKTLPGSKEQWEIKITGNKKDQMTAEVLTAAFDASLDQFKPQSWNIPDLYPVYNGSNEWNNGLNGIDFRVAYSDLRQNYESIISVPYRQQYDRLLVFSVVSRFVVSGEMRVLKESTALAKPSASNIVSDTMVFNDKVSKEEKMGGKDDLKNEKKSSPNERQQGNIQIRKNFNETAFFQPDLKTDARGNVEINFTMPDALTKWKWMILANTKDLSFGYAEKSFITQKELMLQTNMPRFFRAGDTMLLPVKISNLSSKDLSGTVHLVWLDAGSNQNMDTALGNLKTSQPFNVNASQTAVVFFQTIIPAHFSQPLLYRAIANADIKGTDYSDGEENIIPVLSKQMLVTESLPLNMVGREEQHFTFDKLLKSGTSSSLQNQSLTVEFTTNPAWYAVQSLPYLMEFPYECAEQTFNRFYANALASHIVQVSPAMQVVFEKWKNTDTAALLSNLQKNEELKSVILQETPWVLQAQTETQQKKNLALLFDMIRMRASLKSALDKLEQMQSESGAFAWFKGGQDDRYITQYIISGIGKLGKLNAIPLELAQQLNKITGSAIAYLDKEIKADFETRNKFPNDQSLGSIQIQYLYARSFFPDIKIPAATKGAFDYYITQAAEKWMKQSVYMQAMISLFLNRMGDSKTANEIIASLQENATQTTALGMYWKSVSNGYYWQDAPVETQSLLIETFQELKADKKIIDQMKYWLLEQKHTSHWPTTKATADACYALLLDGSDWLANNQNVSIQLGTYLINSTEEKTEAGTGYFKKQIPGDQVKPEMGNIDVTLRNLNPPSVNAQRPTPNAQRSTPSYGAIYWQYFEDLDKITAAQTPLSITKNLFIERNSNTGPVLEAVSEKNVLRPGDKLTMRIIIKSDRDLEYVHLKDMRAACLEPVNVLSSYKWQHGLGYYETTKDASTNFFFDRLPKGTYVFEYPVFVTTAGNYSNGISELECMYAPEFAAHSEGIRIQVESK
jgi:uncharacterized protein YfaS (alpha-2-macroglobulin family)